MSFRPMLCFMTFQMVFSRTLHLKILPDDIASQYSAYALDGTNYAYYAPENSKHITNWVIYLEGGGECESSADCIERSRTELGSSDELDDTVKSNSIDYIISSASSNPFSEFGFLYLPYLSGDDWLGTQLEASNPWADCTCQRCTETCVDDDNWYGSSSSGNSGEEEGTIRARTRVSRNLNHRSHGRKTLKPQNNRNNSSSFQKNNMRYRCTKRDPECWFSGHNNFIAAITNWAGTLADVDLANILLTGGSAGGQGAFFLADALQDLLPTAVVKANPQYGYFEPAADIYPDWLVGEKTDPNVPYPSSKSPYPVPAWMWNNVSVQFPKPCLDALEHGQSEWLCTNLPVVAASVKVPLFVSTNLFDEWTTNEMEQVPTSEALGPTVADDQRLEYLFTITAPAIGGSVFNVTQAALQSRRDVGAFVPACLEHPMEWASSPSLGGCSHADAVASWYHGNSACGRILIFNYSMGSDDMIAEMAAMRCNRNRFNIGGHF